MYYGWVAAVNKCNFLTPPPGWKLLPPGYPPPAGNPGIVQPGSNPYPFFVKFRVPTLFFMISCSQSVYLFRVDNFVHFFNLKSGRNYLRNYLDPGRNYVILQVAQTLMRINLKSFLFSWNVRQETAKETNDTFISWLKSNEDIKYFEYSNFRNLKPVGKGSYGSVLRANMKNAAGFYALKSFNNDETTLQQIINELDLYRTIGRHENILQLFGVTKIETDVVYQMSEYCLVLEYAHSGTLST
ncbi:hypothetical protein RhiirA4_443922, partial [Rhizophagus irregularis]